jgi:hypothetical protein
VSHHTQATDCPLCVEKCKDLHPTMAAWFWRLKHEYPDCHVSCSYRGKAEQEDAFKRGTSKLHWPNSMHNTKPARAMDLFQIRDDFVPSWADKYFAELATWLKLNCAPIDWGHDLWGWDRPHFQLKRGES